MKDVVWILGEGSTWDNQEIKYSVKSVKKHLKGYRNLFVVGENPRIEGVTHIPAKDPYKNNKEANICHKVKTACEHPDISDDFLFMNDDHFLLHDIKIEDIKPYSKEDLFVSETKGIGRYQVSRILTYRVLKERGLTTYNFDIHTPIIYNKKKFLEVISQYNWAHFGNGFLVKSLYGNTLKLGHVPYSDCKIKNDLNLTQIEERVSGRWVFSIGDGALNEDMKEFLEENYGTSKKIDQSRLVSVIMPCYKQGHFLDESISCVLNQTYQNFEIIIVDDCSPDNSWKLIGEQLKRDSRISALRHSVNQGVSAARNTAIKEAKGEYILPFDSDDKLDPRMLEKCVEAMNDGCDIAYTDCQRFGGDNIQHYARSEWSAEDMKTGNLLCCCSMLRRSDWAKVDGYDEEMRDGFEDWMFWLKLAHSGCKGKRIPKPLFLYRVSNTGLYSHTKPIKQQIIKQMHDLHPEIFGDKK